MSFFIPFGHKSGKEKFVANGGSVTTEGDYTVHTFYSSGTFSVASGVKDIEVSIVAGGGGGGEGICKRASMGGYHYYRRAPGGAGGAGGRNRIMQTAKKGSYNITVGAGGVSNSGKGGASSFDAIVCSGGDGGGAYVVVGSTFIAGSNGAPGTPFMSGVYSSYGLGGPGGVAPTGWENYGPGGAGGAGVVVIKYLTK